MKRVGLGTFTEIDGEQVENGMLVDDDFPEPEMSVDVDGAYTEVTTSFKIGDLVSVIDTQSYSTGNGPVQEVLADATGCVIVQFSDVTREGKMRFIPSTALAPFVTGNVSVSPDGVAQVHP